MSAHRSPSTDATLRGRRTGVLRALLSLGIVLGIGSVGTTAYWTDTATMNAGSIQAGTMDLQLDSNLAGVGGTWANPKLTMANMIPGESLAVTVPVQRASGSIGFTYNGTATASGDLASAIRWTITDGTAGTAATNANGIRTNTCSGTTLASNVTLGTTAQTVVPTRTMSGSTTSQNLCLRMEMPTSVTIDAAGKSLAATFVLTATQLS